jgi:hypothetical protein
LSITEGETHSQLQVRETYVGFTAGDLDFTVGRRLVRWGAGYAFTATGVLDPPRIPTDPTDRLSLRQGRDLVQGDWVRGTQSVTVAWASSTLSGLYDTTAVRYNSLAAGLDSTFIIAHDTGGTTLVGVNLTRVIGNSIELHGEAAWRNGAALLAGGKYTAATGVSLIAEFYTPPDSAYYRATDNAMTSGRRYYGFLRIAKSRLRELPGWKEWDIAADFVANFRDSSRVAVLDIARRIGSHFTAYTHGEVPAGRKAHAEFGLAPYSSILSAGIRFQL